MKSFPVLSLLRLLTVLGAALLLTSISAQADGRPQVNITRHQPCNLFSTQEPVSLTLQLAKFPPGKVDVVATVTDSEGEKVWAKTLAVEVLPNGTAPLILDMGVLGRGYYELAVSVKSAGSEATGKASFGVIEFVQRTAAEVRDQGYRFGLKWWGGVAHKRECEEAMVKLGLQWTRLIQNQTGDLTTAQMLTEFPMNAVIKVERFPKELYDEARYGPLPEWEAKYGKGAWTLKTLPKKEPYQQLLQQQLAALPKDQQVFEIWNEPWDKMSPEDFATISQWIVEVILKDRPNAIIGPNLLGNTSAYEYDARVIKAGGMKGMKMVALHPYAGSEDRQWMRNYRAWLKEQLGQDIAIYVTEYGSHSTPAGPSKRSEQEQAERVVRQSLSLYAEDVKAFMPHWLGQSEQNPTYIEDWFGFIRKNEEPKPVLLAYANCARLVDGSRYVGDMWYGPSVGAMLFEKNKVYTLALWTLSADPAVPPAKQVEVEPGVAELALVGMIGKETKTTVSQGKLKVNLTDAPVYLVGVSPDLEKQATTELRPDRWPKPAKPLRLTRAAPRFKSAPVLNGQLDSWNGALQIGLSNPKVNGDDASGTASTGWDEKNLYLTVNMRDNEMLNTQTRAKLYLHDSIELFVTTAPRDEGSGFSPQDHQFFLVPTSGEGKPIVGEVVDRESGRVDDVPGATQFVTKTPKGWLMQATIPWTTFSGFKAEKGTKLALELRVNDADTSHTRFKIDPADAPNEAITPSNPSTWSLLELRD